MKNKREWIFIAICLVLGLVMARAVHAQSIPGIAAPAPQAWVGFGVIGRDISSGGDVPNLVLPSQNGATEAIFEYSGTNASGGLRWVQLFKSNTLPANGTAPILENATPSGQNFYMYGYPIASLPATGFVLACSTTQGFLTVTTANDCLFFAKVSP